jgi:hypothetical protein
MVKISFLNTFKISAMKTIRFTLLTFLFLGVMPCGSHAQSTYLIFKLTNSVPGSNEKLREFSFDRNGETFTAGTYGSYGNGIYFQAGIGKMINPTFGFEISGEFAYGRWHKTPIEEYGNDYTLNGDVKEKVNTVLIKPVMVIRSSGDLLAFYTKLGVLIAPWVRKYERLKLTVYETDTKNTILYETESVEQARLKVGFTASIGVSFRVSQSIALFGEVSGQIMSLPIREGHYTKLTRNGEDLLPSATVSQKEWIYKESGFLEASTKTDGPEIRLYNPANYTSIGLSVGMLFYL